MNPELHIFQITEEDRLEYTLEQIKMGIADAKVEGYAIANAANTNKITIYQEIIITLLVIFVIVIIFKFLQHYIKKNRL